MELLLAQILVTGYLMGLIWFVQLVHYPLLALVGEDRFFDYHRSHTRWTTYAVAPAMLIELGLAAVVATVYHGDPLAWAGLGLVVAVWVSTFLVQVPMHEKLARDGYDPITVRKLVRTNWLRTIAWTLRGVACAAMLVQATFPPPFPDPFVPPLPVQTPSTEPVELTPPSS